MTEIEIEVDGLAELAAALSAIVADADDLGDDLAAFVDDEESRIRAAAASSGRQAKLAARSVTARRTSRGGSLEAGGSGRLPNGNGTYGDLFFGAEFGGGSRPRTRQFPPYTSRGRWFFPTLEGDDDRIDDIADDALDRAAKRWDD